MSLLFGIERCKMDSNGRFKLPVALKKQLGAEDNRFVIRRSIYADCLELWTFASFEAEVALLTKELNRYKKEDLDLLRRLVRCNVIEIDTNDRLLIPSEQKDCLKAAKDIVLQSVGRFIEIWDFNTYNKMDTNSEDFASLVNERLGDFRNNDDDTAR
ncbi:MAG: hypothetical protein KBT04_03690 [Bacteroidales bacterium]|nr:hypothetical protein [Candidatus Colimorpha onthohippi]